MSGYVDAVNEKLQRISGFQTIKLFTIIVNYILQVKINLLLDQAEASLVHSDIQIKYLLDIIYL